jgi:uncharacterized membrane protein YfcA
MCCVSIAGAISHYREGNMVPRVGFVVGLAGMIGAWLGASIGQHIPEHPLQIAAGLTLWLLAALVWIRTRVARQVIASRDPAAPTESGRTVATAVGLGASGGVAAAFFGVGMTPYLQLGMLQALKLDLRQTVGTTMLALIFISLSGSLTLATHGDVSFKYLIGVMIGMTAGSYLGAKLTMRAHPLLLRIGVVATPFVAGAMLIFF